jgi:ATP-dependent RNA helicase DOB1
VVERDVTFKILIMNSTDLFSFLSENAPEDDHDEQDILETVPSPFPTKSAHKRKAESPTRDVDFPVYAPQNGDAADHGVENEPGPSVYKKPRMEETLSAKSTHKRRAELSAGDEDINDPGPSVPKKARVASPKPMVLDDFETEAKREVAASAGLTGSVDTGTRLELKHQVRSYYVLHRVLIPNGVL